MKKSKPIGFLAVLFGLLFFCNPYIAAIDVLPDFIGCAIIYFALSRISHINRRLGEARTAFFKLMAFCLCKDICVLVVFGMSTAAERPVSLLLVTFVNAVVGLYFSYSAINLLFDGIYSLSVLRNCPTLYAGYKRFFGVERSRCEVALRATWIFFILREVLCLLPEFTALTTSSYIDSDLIRIYEYIGLMRAMACILVLFLALLWLWQLLRFFIALSRERSFRAALGEEEQAHSRLHPGNAVIRRYGVSFLLFGIGALLLCDFYLDFQNIIPDALGAAFLLSGLLFTDLSRRQKAIGGTLCVSYGVMATVSSHFAYRFSMEYSAGEISKNASAARAYLHMWLTSLCEFLAFLALLVVLLLCLRTVIAKWAGYLPTHAESEFEQRRRHAFVEDFDKSLIHTFIWGFLSALLSFLYDYIKEFPSHKFFRFLELFWAFDLVMALAFGVVWIVLLSNIHAQIKQRFALDG